MPRRREVDQWFAKYDNPMKDVVMAVRDAMLAADKRVDECIKWQAPTFTYAGNIASFFPKSKQHASLMFHQGAKIPGKHALLQGDGATSKVMKLASVADVKKARRQIVAIVQAWIAWKDGDNAPKKKAVKKKAVKKKAVKRRP